MTVCMQPVGAMEQFNIFWTQVFMKEGWRLYLGEEMKKVLKKIPVITVGMIKTPEVAEKALANGQADFIALGRALLVDAEWAKKALEGRPESLCELCGADHQCE